MGSLRRGEASQNQQSSGHRGATPKEASHDELPRARATRQRGPEGRRRLARQCLDGTTSHALSRTASPATFRLRAFGGSPLALPRHRKEAGNLLCRLSSARPPPDRTSRREVPRQCRDGHCEWVDPAEIYPHSGLPFGQQKPSGTPRWRTGDRPGRCRPRRYRAAFKPSGRSAGSSFLLARWEHPPGPRRDPRGGLLRDSAGPRPRGRRLAPTSSVPPVFAA